MKKIVTLLLVAGLCGLAKAQLNVTLKSTVTYNQDLNDVWGWADPNTGKEIGLIGLREGVSILDVTDASAPIEITIVPGPSSTWRDMKVWEGYAYVTNETGQGILVIDLTDLENFDENSWFYWAPILDDIGGTLSSCHNIYIDEFGFAYLAGCNLNGGGNIIVDVTDPGNPVYVNAAPPVYAHDVYVRDNIMYSSEIYNGALGIYDVSNKNNVVQLASQQTPSSFTHNAWLSDNGNHVFTTDERANAPVTAYDISDLTDIKEVDRYYPIATLGLGVIPHNVHVWEDWLIISYYTDGCIIVDASKPDNMIEVGNFDTWLGGDGGFNGVWGVYPFFPSGTVIATDIDNGAYILEPDYKRACWLEGTVTDAVTGAVLSEANVEIQSSQPNLAVTDINGVYKGGQVIAGTFDVEFSRLGYMDKTLSATLENGELTILNAQLEPLPNFTFSGKVIRKANGNPIPNAVVEVRNDDFTFETQTDGDGNFTLNSVFEGDYDVFGGAWGYHAAAATQTISGGNASMTIELDDGYRDEFAVDLGWQVSGDAATGIWERGIPIGTTSQGGFANPPVDITGDLGQTCYVTGNGGGNAGNDDIDNGTTTLTSPSMDLSGYTNPVLSYYSWFFNGGGSNAPNDALQVRINNGIEEITLETITNSNGSWNDKTEWVLRDWIQVTDNMHLIFESSDLPGSGHLTEAAVDLFEVVEGEPLGTADLINEQLKVAAWPNPFSQQINIRYDLADVANAASLSVYNVLGQQILHFHIDAQRGLLEIGEQLEKGIYIIQLEADGQLSRAKRVVKQ